MSQKAVLTDDLVRKLPFAEKDAKQYRVYDAQLKGFLLLVTPTTKTYCVRLKVRGVDKFLKVCSSQAKSAREARVLARDLADAERLKIRQRAEANGAPTLRIAWADYRKTLNSPRGRRKGPASPKTIEQYTDCVERLMACWLDTPLDYLALHPVVVRDYHAQVSHERGPYIANRMTTVLRMIYTLAQITYPRVLPHELPTAAVNRNMEERRQTALCREEMAAWYKQLRANTSPVRREFHLFTLLSGLRPDSLCPVRWTDLNLEQRALYVRAKGGESFWVPLSDEMIDCIEHARLAGKLCFPTQAETYVFPTDSKSGHMVKPKEYPHKLSHFGDDLRQTYMTMAEALGIPDRHVKLLVNHRIPGEKRRTKRSPGDVTMGYVNDVELAPELRVSQQRISSFIMEHLTKPLVH